MQDELTIKQKAFADYYIETGNATEAAKRAGYSQRTAYRTGADNLKKPHVPLQMCFIRQSEICGSMDIENMFSPVDVVPQNHPVAWKFHMK